MFGFILVADRELTFAASALLRCSLNERATDDTLRCSLSACARIARGEVRESSVRTECAKCRFGGAFAGSRAIPHFAALRDGTRRSRWPKLHRSWRSRELWLIRCDLELHAHPPNTLRLSRAALLGADRTAARQPPRRTQTRPERTAAGVTPVQVGTNRGRPGGRANERGRVGL